MTDKTTNSSSTIGVYIVLLVGIAAIYGLGSKFIAVFGAIDAKYGAALAAAAATVIVSVISVIVSRYLQTRATIRKEHREKKIPVYEDLLSFFFKILMGKKIGKAPDEQEILVFMTEFTQRSMVWASDDVLKVWIKFRSASMNEEEMKRNPTLLMFLYEDVIRAIRRDLGHKNKDLGKGKLLSLFINDISDHVDGDPDGVSKTAS